MMMNYLLPTFHSKAWLAVLCLLSFSVSAQRLAVLPDNPAPSTAEQVLLPNQQQAQPLKNVLQALEKQYQVYFNYDTEMIENIVVVPTMGLDQRTSLEETLSTYLQQHRLGYKKLEEGYYMIYPLAPPSGLVPMERQPVRTDSPSSQSLTLPAKVTNRPFVHQQLLEKTITGQVTDLSTNETLPGVNVLVKGTTVGTVTDIDGNYRLTTPDDAETLVFSSVGYTSEEVAIDNQAVINLEMAPDIQSLSEVVVTAFGIKKQQKALSYATQQVEGEQLAAAGNVDVSKALQGKVAGVSVRQSSGLPGAPNNITIRGSRSLTGDNQPLYVIDGLPISTGGGSLSDGGQGVQGTSRALDINPSDIASLNVLKGPAAAALYGLRASNGVIVITTKSGQGAQRGKPKVSINSNFTADEISVIPDRQTTYAQGEAGVYNESSSRSFGPRISDLGTYTNNVGETVQGRVYDNVRPFFQTGITFNLNADVSNATDFGNYNVGVGFADQQGIIETTGLTKYNARFAGNFDLSEKLKLGVSSNFVNTDVDLMETGSSRSAPFATLWYVPPSYDFFGTPYSVEGELYNQIYFRGAQNNPLWTNANNSYNELTKRFFGNINLDYKLLEWLSVNYRIGIDTYNTTTKNFYNQGDGSTFSRDSETSSGRVYDQSTTNRQINSNLGVTLDKDITEKINLNLLVGNEFYDNRTNTLGVDGRDVSIFGFDNVSGTSTQTSFQNINRIRNVGFYGNLSLSYQNMLFLNATGRNDYVSNMPEGNRSFFYPSVGVSAVVSDIFNINEGFLTFAKVRATYAEVGQAGPVYVQANTYSSGGAQPLQGSGVLFPFNGLNGFSVNNTIINPGLRPQNTSSIEVGANVKFLDNRVGIDYTYYQDQSEDQIFSVPISTTTGFTNELRNAGELQTTGHEIVLYANPVQTINFNWDFNVNFTTYNNEVINLAEGVEFLELGGTPIGSVRAVEGFTYPVIWTTRYLRDPNGNVVVESREDNPRYGFPLQDPEQGVVGSVQPDFEIGFTNTISFKGLTLSAQIDWRKGGDILTGVDRLGKLFGTLAVTEDRESDYVEPGVKGFINAEGDLVVEGTNDIVIKRDQPYWAATNSIREDFVHDGSFVRLREVVLDYQLPSMLVQRMGLQSASVYLTGRNLLLSTDFPNVDPEMSFGGSTNAQGLEYNSLPQTRSFGGGV